MNTRIQKNTTKQFLAVFAVAIAIILAGFSLPQEAEASLITFDVFHRTNPDQQGGFGFRYRTREGLDGRDGLLIRESFRFEDVKFIVDTDTGSATLQGVVKHAARKIGDNPWVNFGNNADSWQLKTSWTNIRDQFGGSLLNNNGGPYDQMFDDLKSLGVGSGEGFTWEDMDMKLQSLTGNPKYQGATNWFEKANGQGDPSVLRWGKFVDDQFGFSGWMMALSEDKRFYDFKGDFHFGLAPVVPEPATMALFGTGLAGLALRRRKKQLEK